MRSILTVKASPTVAMLINTISYTFYAGIVKMTSGQSMAIVLITTALTNIIGVYIAKWLVSLKHKDKLWVVDVTTKKLNRYNLANDLSIFKIQFSVFTFFLHVCIFFCNFAPKLRQNGSFILFGAKFVVIYYILKYARSA